jgi:putative endopeptidase
MSFAESALGEALGKLYCKLFFDESSKAKALNIGECVCKALQERLTEVEWMTSESTREEALKKMERFKVKIGFPDKFIDYSSMEIARDAPFYPWSFLPVDFTTCGKSMR